MLGDAFAVPWFDEEAVFAVLYLKGNSARSGCNDGNTFMNAIGDVLDRNI